jgi:benzoate/toluate 1,2-dioxygenase beta subunit
MKSAVSDAKRREVEAFIYREARLADEHQYSEWEALWADDGRYWVPAADIDNPDTAMSVINDNRSRIRTRIAQLETGRRYSQSPPSRLARTISNIEIQSESAGEFEVTAVFTLVEATSRGRHLWTGRVTYRLREASGGLQMSYKCVDLVDRQFDLPTLAFLI